MSSKATPQQILKELDLSAIPCEFCDVRIEETHTALIGIQNHELISATEEVSVGAFLRVRKDGQWYFSSTTDLSTLQKQLENLAALKVLGAGKSWNMIPGNNGTYENIQYAVENPSLIPLSDKVDLMWSYDRVLAKNSKAKTSMVRYKDIYKIKSYKNSSGTAFHFDFAQCGAAVRAAFTDGDKIFEDYCPFYAVKFADLKNQEAELENFLTEAEKFIHAPLIEPGQYKVVLAPEITGVFVHESFGHNSEADGMIGDPEAKNLWQLGKKVAADFISIVDSGNHSDGSGYCPIDDEGCLATKTYLIKDGILSGRLHSFDTAVAMDERPTGNGRAINFEFEPIVRMTSTYIENGQGSLEDLFKKAEGGIYINSYNYGTGSSLFTIAPARAYRIKDGKPTIPVRANVISGQVFETLLNIEAIANDFEFKHSALGGCGKKGQFPLPVADGGPTILVKDMQVS